MAQAAHDVLPALLPSQRATFDAALAASLGGLPEAAARDGAAVGTAVERAELEHRHGDGWARPFSPLDLPSLPGYWRPTPPAQAPTTFTNYTDVVGFIVERGRHFLMEGPPSLASERYARDFNDTKTVGRVDMTLHDTLLASFTGKFLYGFWRPVTAIRAAETEWTPLSCAMGEDGPRPGSTPRRIVPFRRPTSLCHLPPGV